MGIRIDELNSTVLPSGDHLVAAMKDGLTVRLSIQQIIDLTKAAILDGAPEALDTLNELATALNDDAAAFDTLMGQISNAKPPTGSVLFFAHSTAPAGWLKTNGAELSRTIYADLFAVIGTQFGVGDGTSTFQLPDLRGEFLRGWDDGRGLDAGRIFGQNQSDAIRNIQGEIRYLKSEYDSFRTSHVNGAFNITTNVNAATDNNADGSGGDRRFNVEFDASLTVPTATENRPVNVALLPCIKY